jgi:polysaccharide biosynthesis protein PslG
LGTRTARAGRGAKGAEERPGIGLAHAAAPTYAEGLQASFVMAMIMPINTNTTIATCIQIHVGDMIGHSLPGLCSRAYRREQPHRRTIIADMAAGPGARTASRPHRLIVAVGACLLALSLLGWLAAGNATASVPLGGVNIPGVRGDASLQEADSSIAQAAALHARVVRTDVAWSAFEPQGPGQIDPGSQAFTDRLIEDAAAAGIRVILELDSTPCWASSAPSALLSGCRPSRPNGATSWPPTAAGNRAFATFAAYLAARYGSRLAAIEVWNEPDQANELYFAGPNKPKLYAALLRTAYPAIKAADPSVPVLGGSLVGPNGEFLKKLYAAGIKGFYNGLSVHYYTLTLGAVRKIHEVQLANHDKTPLWLDEFGWSSCWPRERIQQEQGCVTPQVQAANLANTYRSLARTPYVSAVVSYKLRDSAAENFGLTATSGALKPSFAAFAGALASPFGAISRVTLKLRRKGARVVASGSGPVGDYMHLEVISAGVLRYQALFTLDRFNDFSISLPAALGTRGLQVRVYQFWAGPGKGARKSI